MVLINPGETWTFSSTTRQEVRKQDELFFMFRELTIGLALHCQSPDEIDVQVVSAEPPTKAVQGNTSFYHFEDRLFLPQSALIILWRQREELDEARTRK